MDIREVCKQLTAAPGVSGAESEAAAVAASYLREYAAVHTDALGSVVGEIEGDGAHLLLVAHLDQIGFVVTDITDDGFLRVDKAGGPDLARHSRTERDGTRQRKGEGRRLQYAAPLAGRGQERAAAEIGEVLMDTGLTGNAKDKIRLGDRVTVDGEFLNLLGTRVSAPALDNRAGVAVLLRALEILKEKGVSRRMTVVFSSREEVNGAGATAAGFTARADEAIAVDVSFAKTPDARPEACGVMGKGAMIAYAGSVSREMSERTTEIAGEEHIPYQIEAMGGRTGTDLDGLTPVAGGMRSGLVSVPLKYMHTPVEVVDIEDIESCARLIAAYAEKGGVYDA